MSVRRCKKGVLALGLLLLAASPAWCSPFVNPPESSGKPWATPFPYQRNVLWDFAVNPVGGPLPGGTPGAHYEGWADPILRVSDVVSLQGAMAWYETLPGSGDSTFSGVLAIDNRQGDSTLTGSATFHLDNFIRQNPLKHIWTESVGGLNLASAILKLVVPDGFTQTSEGPFNIATVNTDPVLVLANHWFEIRPNPSWENLLFEVSVGPGGFFALDSFHVATECIPEPSTVLLSGFGLVLLAGAGWWRRGRAQHGS